MNKDLRHNPHDERCECCGKELIRWTDIARRVCSRCIYYGLDRKSQRGGIHEHGVER